VITPFGFKVLLRGIAATTLLSTLLLSRGPALAAAGADGAPATGTVPTNNPHLFAFPAPPAGFDPLTASAAELKRYGLPLPPAATKHPKAFQRWQQIVRHAHRAVTPHFTPKPGLKHNATSGNWSGGAVTTPACGRFGCGWVSQAPIAGVEGEWTVPDVSGSSEIGQVSEWVGLDGDGNNQVQQIGTDATNVDPGIAVYDAWVELYPDDSQGLSGLTIGSGDDMFGQVQFDEASNTLYFFLMDITQNAYVSFATAATYLSPGHSAEWIVERPFYNGTYDHPLPWFGTVNLTSLWFFNDQGSWYQANNNPYNQSLIDMTGTTGTVLATTTATGDSSDTVTWQNYQ
jgi:hypothetical protein